MKNKKPVVLVIDDEKVIRDSFCNYLEDNEYDVLAAGNGRAGLEIFERENPDLVLLDLRMPEIDGLDVLAMVKERAPETAIIVVSGQGGILDAVEALRLGAWDYLIKPVEDLSVLRHSLEIAMERTRLIRENRMYQENLEEEVAKRTEELARTNSELQHINTRLRKIVETTKDFSMCSGTSQFGSRLLEEFGHHTQATGGSFYLVEDDGLSLVHALDPGHAPDFIPFPLKEDSLLKRIMDESKPLLIHDVSNLTKFTPSGWQGYRNGSVLMVPLLDERENIMGILCLHSKIQPPFEEHDKEIGAILASYSCEALRATRATEALHRREGLFRTVIDASKDAMIAIDQEGMIPIFNQAAEQIFGMTKKEMLGKTLDCLMPAEYRQRHQDYVKGYFTRGEPSGVIDRTVELPAIRRDGSVFPIELSLSAGQSADQRFVLAVIRDITDRKQAGEKLHWQSQALEQSLDGIAIADMNGTLLFANRAWADMHGYTTQELLGKNMIMFYTEDQVQRELRPFFEQTKLKGGHEAEIHHVTKTGKIFPTRMSNTLLRDEHGTSIGMIGISRDITEEMDLEAQLRQAQKMESIGRLAGGVAHDFNNLLTPILGYTGILLLDFSPEDPRYDSLMQIQKAAERAESLARQLLAFSRKQVLEMKTVDLSQVISGFEKILRSTIREDIELQTKITPSPCRIKADVSQIEQILMNLLVNAQDAMPDGGRISIEVAEMFMDKERLKAHPGAIPGPNVMLKISDIGCGMDRETLKQVFEPFFTTKERGKGTGLGLSTVYGIIQQHNGTIRVDSKPGEGTRFTICFPSTDESAEHTAVPQAHREITDGSETVLVVEDDESVRNLVCSILKRQSYWVIDAENADECLNAVEQHTGNVHLLITDVVMPKMNGRELYQRLTPRFPDLKVLYMSGYADDVIRHHGVREKGVHFLQKPVSVHALTGKVRAVLDG